MAYSSNFYHTAPGNFPENQWKTPFALAVALHLLVLSLSFLPPSLFHRRPVLPEVITINLFSAEEQQPKKAVPKKRQAPKPKPEPKKVVPKKAPPPPPPPVKKPVVSVAPKSVPPPPVAAPEKVVSLKPRKLKKEPPPPPKETVNDKNRLKALERIQARVNKQREDQKLKHDLAKLRESLHTVEEPAETPAPPPVETVQEEAVETSEPSAPSTGSTELMDMALKHYYIAVSRRIHNHWVLPEIQNWDESLEALMVVIVRQDGSIKKSFFEKKSDNIYFNQFVERTIKEAAPLPIFPADLKKTELEIGLRFHPSGLF